LKIIQNTIIVNSIIRCINYFKMNNNLFYTLKKYSFKFILSIVDINEFDLQKAVIFEDNSKFTKLSNRYYNPNKIH
jgi:hypothetical protein